MRLIDADANIETMKKCAANPESEQALLCYRYTQRILEEAPTVKPASQWRRVEDGLPEKDEWVLAITKSYKGARIYNISTVDSDGRWWTTSQNGMREIHYIEYWMPIEPPKEDE